MHILMPPLQEKWTTIADTDRDLLPLFECFTSLAQALGAPSPPCYSYHLRVYCTLQPSGFPWIFSRDSDCVAPSLALPAAMQVRGKVQSRRQRGQVCTA